MYHVLHLECQEPYYQRLKVKSKAVDYVLNDNDRTQLTLFVVSDSIGETAQRMIHATLTQFPDVTRIEIKNFLLSKIKMNYSMCFLWLRRVVQSL